MKKVFILFALGVSLLTASSCGPEETAVYEEPVTSPSGGNAAESMMSKTSTDEGTTESRNEAPADNEDPYADLREEYKGDPEGYLAAMYAQKYGVTVEEAKYRLDLQNRIGPLGAELDAAGLEGYSGFWIQHEPHYCLVAAFTGDNGEELIAPYREKYPEFADLLEVHRVTYTFDELISAQEAVSSVVEKLGVFGGSATYIMKNKVEVIVTDMSVIEQAIADGNLVVPDCVEIVEGDGVIPE